MKVKVKVLKCGGYVTKARCGISGNVTYLAYDSYSMYIGRYTTGKLAKKAVKSIQKEYNEYV